MARRYRREPMKANVIVYEIASGEVQSENIINLTNPTDIRWLQRLIKWAWYSQHSVEVFNIADEL